jgi:large subunit ribosomal protein L11
MAKEILALIKLQIDAGKATPAPPIGPALGQRQINIMEFCKQFNDRTKNMGGVPCPVIITAYKDKTFEFIVKQPPVSYFLKQLAGVSGSKTPGRTNVAKISKKDIKDLLKKKIVDMNCFDNEDSALSMFIGSARSMGFEVVE